MQLIPDQFPDLEKYMRAPKEATFIRPASYYVDQVVDMLLNEDSPQHGMALPWSDTHSQFRLRPGELTVWAGLNKAGKSMLAQQVLMWLLPQGAKVLICSFEMQVKSLMYRAVRQAVGAAEPSIPAIRAVHEWTQDKMWFWDHFGQVARERVLAVLRYAIAELGVNHLLVDSLTKVCDHEDYTAQHRFVSDLHGLAMDQNVHIHLVAHMRKSAANPGERTTRFDIRGASEISDQADNVLLLSRVEDKEDDDDKPDAFLRVDKQRHGAWEGSIRLWTALGGLQFVRQPGRAIDLYSHLPDWHRFA